MAQAIFYTGNYTDKSASAEALTKLYGFDEGWGGGQWRLERVRDEAKEMKRNDEG